MEAISSLEEQKIPFERRETFTTIVTEQLSLGSAATTALDFDSQPSNQQNEQEVPRENAARRRESKEAKKKKKMTMKSKTKKKKKKQKDEGTEIPLEMQRERLSSRDTSDSDDLGHEIWLDDCCTSSSSDWNVSLYSNQSNPRTNTHGHPKTLQNSNVSSLFFQEGSQTASNHTATTQSDSFTEHSIPLSSGQSTNYSTTDFSSPSILEGDGNKDEISRDLLVSYMKAMGASERTAEQVALNFVLEQSKSASHEIMTQNIMNEKSKFLQSETTSNTTVRQSTDHGIKSGYRVVNPTSHGHNTMTLPRRRLSLEDLDVVPHNPPRRSSFATTRRRPSLEDDDDAILQNSRRRSSFVSTLSKRRPSFEDEDDAVHQNSRRRSSFASVSSTTSRSTDGKPLRRVSSTFSITDHKDLFETVEKDLNLKYQSGTELGLLQAVEVKEDEMDPESHLPIVYADSSPLRFKDVLTEKPIRCIIIIVVVLLAIIIGASVTSVVVVQNKSKIPQTSYPTMAPSASPTLISQDILDAASRLSTPELLEDPTSPQFQAVGWMSTYDTIDTGQNFGQRYILVVMYFSLWGDEWFDRSNWLNPSLHECEWSKEISCEVDLSDSPIVMGIEAIRNNLQGSIPPEIGYLQSAEKIVLNKNRIGGTIPTAMGLMTSLTSLDLSGNMIAGSIPTEIEGIQDLVYLDLSQNRINSTIPNELFSLKYLRELTLSFNSISGYLDDEVTALESLTLIDLRNNDLTGTIPLTLDRILTLKGVYFDNNHITGNLPPVSESIIRMETLSFAHNLLEGNLVMSSDYINFLAKNISDFRLEHIDISYNLLDGPISPIFGFLPTLKYFDLSGNNFVGTFPSNVGWDFIQHLAAGHNSLTGTIPIGYPKLTHLDMSGNQFSTGIPVELCEQVDLQFLFLSENPLRTSIPECFSDFSGMLNLDLSGSELSGSIPKSMGRLIKLETVDLQRNALTGPIPTELGQCSSLKNINLNQNQITGIIPSEFGNLSHLSSLDLSQNDITGGMPDALVNAVSLESLQLNDNPLHGSIPTGLCHVSNLNLTTSNFGCNLYCSCCYDTLGCQRGT